MNRARILSRGLKLQWGRPGLPLRAKIPRAARVGGIRLDVNVQPATIAPASVAGPRYRRSLRQSSGPKLTFLPAARKEKAIGAGGLRNRHLPPREAPATAPQGQRLPSDLRTRSDMTSPGGEWLAVLWLSTDELFGSRLIYDARARELLLRASTRGPQQAERAVAFHRYPRRPRQAELQC